MKVVDIADEIHRELDTPTGISIPSISYWVRGNIGALNNYINTTYIEKAVTLEITDSDAVEIGIEEVSILKKMYKVHYYDRELRANLNTLNTDTILFVSDQGSSVKKVNRLDVAKHLTSVRNSEQSNLDQLIHSYKIKGSAPRQVVGDDTEEGPGIGSSVYPYKRTLGS